jgi:hypothetical protein
VKPPSHARLIFRCKPTERLSNPSFASVYAAFPKEGLKRSYSLLLKAKLLTKKDINARIIESFRPRNDFGFELGLFGNFLAEQVK